MWPLQTNACSPCKQTCRCILETHALCSPGRYVLELCALCTSASETRLAHKIIIVAKLDSLPMFAFFPKCWNVFRPSVPSFGWTSASSAVNLWMLCANGLLGCFLAELRGWFWGWFSWDGLQSGTWSAWTVKRTSSSL